MTDSPRYTSHHPGPNGKDWLLLAINIAFVVGGIVLIPKNPDAALVTITFFGTCLAVTVGTFWRKYRDARFRSERIDVVGGVPIRSSRYFAPLLGGWLAALGVILFVFGHDYPLLFRIIAAFVALVGIVVLAGALLKRWPMSHLQFDPDALTIAQHGWLARIPWDNIAAVHESEYASNPMLLIALANADGLDIEPPVAHARARRDMARTQATFGAEFAIMTTQFGLPLPLLGATVARYVTDSGARTELRPRLT